jgi:asparagine synthetase B (glutamine-hydrolysing)
VCGIVGFINLSGTSSMKAEAAYKELLFVDQLRGSDATGACLMGEDGVVDWIKAAGDAGHFFDRPEVQKYFRRAGSDFAWIGHNRAGTIGKNNNDNAHPFQHDNILGVHNGTLRNKYEIVKDGFKFEVDSDAFFKGVQLNGIKETAKAADGAYSVVYFDTDDKSINFVRNGERPMHFLTCIEKGVGALPDKKFIFFGSEIGMLFWVCSRNGFAVGDNIASTPLKHYKFVPGDEKPVISTVEEYKSKYPIYTPGYSKSRYEEEGDACDPRFPVGAKGRKTHTPPALNAPTVVPPPTNQSSKDSPAPFELRKLRWFNAPGTNAQDKKTLERVFRSAVKGSTISFFAHELVDLGSSYQILGKLAGKKKEDLPVIVTTVVDKGWLDAHDSDSIYSGTITSRGFTPDNNTVQIIVSEPREIMNLARNMRENKVNAE